MTRYKTWDPAIRIFHWGLAALFAANALVVDEDNALHDRIGYAIAALIGLRLLWGLLGPRRARLSTLVPRPGAVLDHLSDIATGRHRAHLGHSPLGALMILNLLSSIALIALTGHMMTTNAFWGIEWVEEIHEMLVGWAGLSVGVHIAAVLWESHRTGINLPRAMVTGAKSVPDGVKIET